MLFKELANYYDKLEAVSSRIEMVKILTELCERINSKEISKTIYMTQGVLAPPFDGIEFGIAEKIVQDALAIATGFDKAYVEKYYKKSGDLGTAAQNLKTESRLKRMNETKLNVVEVYQEMMKIAKTSGEGSKEVKIRILANMIASASPQEAKYIVRYPIGQLRLGVGDATILEALAAMATGDRKKKDPLERAYNICSDLGSIAEMVKEGGLEAVQNMRITLFKPIRPALAERLQTTQDIVNKLGKCAVEQKYDGFRCQVHKSGKRVRIFSRRLEDTTAMFPDLAEAALKDIKADKIIFEGEALAYNESTEQFLPFQETIQRKRKHGISEKIEQLPLHLFGFDLMYLDGQEYINQPYHKRRSSLEKVLKCSKIITPTTMIMTDSAKELQSFFETSIENGLEGIIAKDLNAPYTTGARKFAWIKMKRSYMGELSDTVDLVIVGYYLGRGNRAEFKFGGLLCAVYNDKKDIFETVSRIGTGFTEKQMTELQEKLSKTTLKHKPARVDAIITPDFWVEPNYVVTINADEITRSPMHTCGRSKERDIETGYALRFPRIVGDSVIRADKSPEQATTTDEIIEMFELQKKVGVKE